MALFLDKGGMKDGEGETMKYSLSLLFLLTMTWGYVLGKKILAERYPSGERRSDGSVGLFV